MKKISILLSIIVFVLLTSYASGEEHSADVQKQILSLVSVGMDIDDARDVLMKNGFRVGEKYFPTNKQSYYQMNIPIINKVPSSETARYVTNSSPGETKAFIVIKAKLNGTITEVE